MAFCNRGYKPLPTTFAACLKLWGERRSKRFDYITLLDNTLLFLDEGRGVFYVAFHGNVIVTFHPEFKVIDACGYSESPTTQDRITRLTGVLMRNDRKLGFDQYVRVGGYPYFAGMRINNHRQVLEEDRKPDYKTRPKREYTLRYATLWRRIFKVLVARWEIGEFKEYRTRVVNHTYDEGLVPFLACEKLLSATPMETNLPHDLAMALLSWRGAPETGDLATLLTARKALVRPLWLAHHDAYEIIEVK